jgi:hypothetical protein
MKRGLIIGEAVAMFFSPILTVWFGPPGIVIGLLFFLAAPIMMLRALRSPKALDIRETGLWVSGFTFPRFIPWDRFHQITLGDRVTSYYFIPIAKTPVVVVEWREPSGKIRSKKLIRRYLKMSDQSFADFVALTTHRAQTLSQSRHIMVNGRWQYMSR